MNRTEILQKAVTMLSNPQMYHLFVNAYKSKYGEKEYINYIPTFYTKYPTNTSQNIGLLAKYDRSTCFIERFSRLDINNYYTRLDDTESKNLYKKLKNLIKLRLKQTELIFLYKEIFANKFFIVIDIYI